MSPDLCFLHCDQKLMPKSDCKTRAGKNDALHRVNTRLTRFPSQSILRNQLWYHSVGNSRAGKRQRGWLWVLYYPLGLGPVQKKTLYYPLGLDQIISCTEFKGNLQNLKAF